MPLVTNLLIRNDRSCVHNQEIVVVSGPPSRHYKKMNYSEEFKPLT